MAPQSRISGEFVPAEKGRHEEQTAASAPTGTILYTIGHSNHAIEEFVGLLKTRGVTAMVDVRSAPYSRFHPQFNKQTLASSLQEAGIAYMFLGEELGARPDEQACYDNGQVDFGRVAGRDQFKRGLERLVAESKRRIIAVMCAEKEPLDCHRTILVCRSLKARGVHIKHILADGSLEDHRVTEARLIKATRCERTLFDLDKSASDILARAYTTRAREIAYRAEQEAGTP